MASGNVLNFNVGVLGHVDSGKTSLSKALSTIASTASFDKNPQSKERGITLDLGFSSFTVDISSARQNDFGQYSKIQYTLVDCPGHASLIRTIIGGAQIIDLMMLVIDITKGVQTQTAECLVIGEITCNKMIVVLNKLDMIPKEKQVTTVEKMKKRILKTLETTQFSGCPVIAVAAKPGDPEAPETEAIGVSELISTLEQYTYLPSRCEDGHFVFAVDHCFSIRGQGTVMTGTTLSGKVCVNDTVEIPSLATTKKVKSMQMFRKPIDKIKQGDRVGICVTQFDPSLLERGLVCSPGALVTVQAVLTSIHKITYYKGPISTKAKFHVTLGHETVMGRISIFSEYIGDEVSGQMVSMDISESEFNFSREYLYQDEYISPCKGEGDEDKDSHHQGRQYALIELERPVICSPHSIIIGSRLDTDVHTSTCRIAFHGIILHAIDDSKYQETILPRIKVFKTKTREGLIERATDRYSLIAKSLFKKETNITAFANLKVVLSSGERGLIEGSFGQSGKVKIRIPDGLSDETFQRYSSSGKRKGKGKTEDEQEQSTTDVREPVKIFLNFKRYVYDPSKKMIQS